MNDLFLLEPEYRYRVERARSGLTPVRNRRWRRRLRDGQTAADPTRRTGSAEVSSVVHDIMDRMASELIGRDAELEQLSSSLGISTSGSAAPAERASVLLAGDAGVGKTRLLTELRDRAVDERVAGPRRALPRLRRLGPALPALLRDRSAGSPATCPTLVDDVATRHPALLRLLPGQRMLSQATDPESIPADQRGTVRRRSRAGRGGRRPPAAAAGRRGPPLGRPVDARPDQLPLRPRLRRRRSPSSAPTAPTTCTADTRSVVRSRSGPG